MKRRNYSNGGKKFIIILSSLIILFLISFASSAFIYINSKNLVFADNIKDVEDMALKIDEQEEAIADLQEQLDRYKTLYEGAIKETNHNPTARPSTQKPTISKAPTSTSKPTLRPTKTPEDDIIIPTDTPITQTPKVTPTIKPTTTPNSEIVDSTSAPTPILKPTPPPFAED